MASTHLRILVVNTSKGPCVEKQLIQSSSIHPVRVGGYWGFLGENNLSRYTWVDSQHAPVHEPSITQIRVVDFFRGPLKDFMNQLLRLV